MSFCLSVGSGILGISVGSLGSTSFDSTGRAWSGLYLLGGKAELSFNIGEKAEVVPKSIK